MKLSQDGKVAIEWVTVRHDHRRIDLTTMSQSHGIDAIREHSGWWLRSPVPNTMPVGPFATIGAVREFVAATAGFLVLNLFACALNAWVSPNGEESIAGRAGEGEPG